MEDGFATVFHPLKMRAPELVHESKHISVSAFPLRHRIECYGFRFDELPHSRRVPDGEGGFVREPVRTVSYAYCSDTEPFAELPSWVRGVDVLYHESTYTDAYKDKARKHHHSTAAEAARCALDCGAGRLLLGHYSSRVRDVKEFEEEARKIFPESYACDEGDVIEIC